MASKYLLPGSFYSTLVSTFKSARESGHLFYFDSTSKVFTKGEIPYLVTLTPSLGKKSESKPKKDESKPFNPFLPPDTKLVILPTYADEFTLVLNKFSVIPNHFLCITKEFKPQTSPLNPKELLATYNILKQINEQSGERFIAFYNCGEESGASQSHKHIQFLPLTEKNISLFPDELVGGTQELTPKKPRLESTKVPFANYIVPIPNETEKIKIDEDLLGQLFITALSRTLTTLRDSGSSGISFNVVMTTRWILLVPRKQETYEGISINSLGVVGILLAKNEKELEFLSNEENVQNVWSHIGYENTAGISEDEYHY